MYYTLKCTKKQVYLNFRIILSAKLKPFKFFTDPKIRDALSGKCENFKSYGWSSMIVVKNAACLPFLQSSSDGVA